jgi:formylmethanofuran--tetrahydromethanopterin N-formyltransferase
MKKSELIEVENTYAEAFDGLYSRLLITAKNEELLKKAAYNSTALPLTVLGESEGGVEKWLAPVQTPDKRLGAMIQIWVGYRENAAALLEKELGKRIRQGILVVPTTTVFNALSSTQKIDIMEKVGHCGDGYEFMEKHYGRDVINIPIMMGEFRIERYLGYSKGVMGGNIWYLCKNMDAALEIGGKALQAIRKIDGVITSFDICSAGSKVETKYPEIGPTTNHPYCPTLKGKIPDSKVPEGVGSIPEIVINGVSLEAVKNAMKAGVESVLGMKGLVGISAGNYSGKLGKYRIYLKEL